MKHLDSYSKNPGPGTYDPTKADEITKSKSQNCIIKQPNSFRIPPEMSPAPGEYDRHLKPFGSDVPYKIDFGSPYKFTPNENPPPGLYDVENATNYTRPKS